MVIEVYDTNRRMKDNRAPGEDAITAELIKSGGRRLWKNIHQLVVSIREKVQMPEEWRTANICPIYKKGNKLECKNYRGILLLHVAYKTFTNILAQRIKVYTEEIQCGFRQGQSTTDHVFTIRQILEKLYEYNITLHQLYISKHLTVLIGPR
jgi:hypothetical protein